MKRTKKLVSEADHLFPRPKPAKQDSVKARVMFTYKNSRGEKCVQSHKKDLDSNPWIVAVIPAPTQQAAKAIVKTAPFLQAGELEQHRQIRVALDDEDRTGAGYDHTAWQIMHAIGLTTKTFLQFAAMLIP